MERATWKRCGREKNQFVVLADGTAMCARYRHPHNKYLRGASHYPVTPPQQVPPVHHTPQSRAGVHGRGLIPFSHQRPVSHRFNYSTLMRINYTGLDTDSPSLSHYMDMNRISPSPTNAELGSVYDRLSRCTRYLDFNPALFLFRHSSAKPAVSVTFLATSNNRVKFANCLMRIQAQGHS